MNSQDQVSGRIKGFVQESGLGSMIKGPCHTTLLTLPFCSATNLNMRNGYFWSCHRGIHMGGLQVGEARVPYTVLTMEGKKREKIPPCPSLPRLFQDCQNFSPLILSCQSSLPVLGPQPNSESKSVTDVHMKEKMVNIHSKLTLYS